MTSVVKDEHSGTLHSGRDEATVFASSLMEQVNREDITSMVFIQRDMLSRFEKTNEMLINFNILSSGRYEATLKDFHKHTQLLSEMKKDLDTVFKRIRLLKQRLEKTYPEAFSACSSVFNLISDEEEDEVDDSSDDYLIPIESARQSLMSKDASSPESRHHSQDPPLVTITNAGSPTSPEKE
ncbi:kxDL motif-containing protein 1-like [Physella acuta]|uniref:kxDL motif-containing protein 1-like n=1 Tax=Physella acuta TaxID=109671 RepID=UPI0027DD4DA6|nr:kxDL motif-containing protein 1-like [Physella acuta]XP_059163222.1 kxDL motif-containing protein 1-like [Physella acuta]